MFYHNFEYFLGLKDLILSDYMLIFLLPFILNIYALSYIGDEVIPCFCKVICIIIDNFSIYKSLTLKELVVKLKKELTIKLITIIVLISETLSLFIVFIDKLSFECPPRIGTMPIDDINKLSNQQPHPLFTFTCPMDDI